MRRIIENRVDDCFLAAFLLTSGVVRLSEETKLLPSGEIEPRFIAPTDGHFFDIKTNSTEEVAKVVLEELKTRDSTKRITNSDPIATVNGVPQIEFSEYNVHARAEFTATQRSFQLARECNLIFWISAEDGAMGLSTEEAKEEGFVYSDGRFNIYFRTIENGEIVLKGKHIPLLIDRYKSLRLGKNLIGYGGKTVGNVDSVEDLRVQPIGLNLKETEDWLEECRRMLPELEEFWQVIERGDDLKQEKKMRTEVEEAKIIAKGDNYIFQRELQRRGIEINEVGIHGAGYLGNQSNGSYEFKIEMRNGEFFTEPVLDKQGNLICPVCGAKVKSNDTKCSLCGIGLDKEND